MLLGGKLSSRAQGNLINLRSTHHPLGLFPALPSFTTPTHHVHSRVVLASGNAKTSLCGTANLEKGALGVMNDTSSLSQRRRIHRTTGTSRHHPHHIAGAPKPLSVEFPVETAHKNHPPAKTDFSAPPQTTPTTHLKPQINRQHG